MRNIQQICSSENNILHGNSLLHQMTFVVPQLLWILFLTLYPWNVIHCYPLLKSMRAITGRSNSSPALNGYGYY